MLISERTAQQLYVHGLFFESLLQFVPNNVVFLVEAARLLHHFAELVCEVHRGFCGRFHRFSTAQFLEQRNVLLFGDDILHLLVEELHPEFDQLVVIYLSSLENAVEIQVCLPPNHGIGIVHVHIVYHKYG